MNIKQYFTSQNITIVAVLAFVVGAFGLYQIHILNVAHSSFENYYKFRGCVELIDKTNMDATCRLPSGETIRLVEVNHKWFLDGDLGW